MSLQSFSSNLSSRILELYSEMDKRTSEFQSRSGLKCPAGCGQCCESPKLKATVIELLPAAEELFYRGKAQQWLECIASIGETGRCVFFQPDPSTPGNGHCQLYAFRPSICRVFGFAVMKDKNGKPELVSCRCLNEKMAILGKEVQGAIWAGMPVPSVDYFFLKIMAFEPSSLGRRQVPINQALRLALEQYGLAVRLIEANGASQADSEG